MLFRSRFESSAITSAVPLSDVYQLSEMKDEVIEKFLAQLDHSDLEDLSDDDDPGKLFFYHYWTPVLRLLYFLYYSQLRSKILS